MPLITYTHLAGFCSLMAQTFPNWGGLQVCRHLYVYAAHSFHFL